MNSRRTSRRFAGLLVIALCSTMAGAQAEELRYATLQSPLNVNVKEGIEPFADRIAKRTDGKLSLRIFPSSQLLGARGAVAGIGDGIAETGFVVPAYQGNELPHIAALGNMGTYGQNPLAVVGAVNEFILLQCPECRRDYESQNVLPLVSHATPNYVLQCNRAVESKEDLVGLKIRSVGIFSARFEELRAVPVNLPSSDSAEALMRGQVDCVHASWDWLIGFGLQDGVKHILDVPTGSYRGLGGFVINLDTWKNLLPAQREVLVDEAPALVADLILGMLREEDEARTWALEHGIKVTKGTGELRSVLGSSRNDEKIMAARAKALGVKNYEAFAASFRETLEKWEAIAARTGRDRAAYVKALRREIYSRL